MNNKLQFIFKDQCILKNIAFAALKNACKGGLPYKNFNDLEKGEYEVKSFSIRQMSFGLCVCAYFEDFYVALPDRFMQQVGQRKKIEELNSEKYLMIFAGKIATRQNFVDVDFIKITSDVEPINIEMDDEGGPSEIQN